MSLLVFLLVAGISPSFAQHTAVATKETRTPEQRAEMLTQKISKDLGFTSDQTAKLQAIELKHAKQLEELKTKYAGKNKELTQAEQALAKSRDEEIKAALPSVYAKYEEWKKKKK